MTTNQEASPGGGQQDQPGPLPSFLGAQQLKRLGGGPKSNRSSASNMSRISKDKARAMRAEQEAVSKLSRRLQMLLKKSPAIANVLARAVWAKHRDVKIDDATLMATAQAYEKSTPIVPRLGLNQPPASQRQGRDTNVWTTEGGVLMSAPSSRAPQSKRDTSARHDELTHARRQRKLQRQYEKHTARQAARQRQRRHTKHRNNVGGHLPEEKEPPRTERVQQIQGKQNDIWYRKAQLDAKIEKNQRAAEKQKKKEEQVRLKQELQGQMQLEEQEKLGEEQAKAEYDRQVLQDVERWRHQQQVKFQREMAKNKHQADMQAEQRAERKRQFQAEAAEKKQYDDQLVKKLERQQAKAVQKQKAAEKKARADAEKLAQANKIAEQIAALKVEEEKQHDLKLAREYLQMEKKRDQERERKLKKMSENVKRKMDRFGNAVQKEEDHRAKQNEQRAKEAQGEFDRREREKEARRRQRRAQRQAEQHEVLAKQVMDKKVKAQMEKEEDRRHAAQWKVEAAAMDLREREAEVRKKKQVSAQQDWLADQIAIKKHQQQVGNFDGLSAVEAALNRRVLENLGCGELANKAQKAIGLAARTRSRAEQLEQQQKELERKMLDRPAGLPSYRAAKERAANNRQPAAPGGLNSLLTGR